MADPKSNARAVVLAGAIVTSPVEATALALRRSAPLYESLPARELPLDLDAVVFRYEILEDSRIIPIAEPRVGRRCMSRHRRR